MDAFIMVLIVLLCIGATGLVLIGVISALYPFVPAHELRTLTFRQPVPARGSGRKIRHRTGSMRATV